MKLLRYKLSAVPCYIYKDYMYLAKKVNGDYAFSMCFVCPYTDNCYLYKLGAQACTIKHEMKGRL